MMDCGSSEFYACQCLSVDIDQASIFKNDAHGFLCNILSILVPLLSAAHYFHSAQYENCAVLSRSLCRVYNAMADSATKGHNDIL